MGFAVAAAGSMLGGWLGSKLMPKPEPIKTDTSIPGISNATVQKGGKKNEEVNAAQSNPVAILPYYEKAAGKFEEYVNKGIVNTTKTYQDLLGYDPEGKMTPREKEENVRNIQNIVKELPGYQFQLNQGLQGVQRAAAAGGMLGSGNTLMAVNDYAQNQAMGYYNNYVGQMQMANDTLNQMYGNIGAEYSRAYTNQGNTFATLSMFNAQQQNDAMSQTRAMKNQQQIAGMNAGIQAGQLGLANSQFNYQVQQNQQAGMAAYNAMNSGSGTTYSAGGMVFPDYTGRGFGGSV